MATTLTGPNGSVVIGAGYPVVLINDQLRIMDQTPKIYDELSAGKMDSILALAGVEMLDWIWLIF